MAATYERSSVSASWAEGFRKNLACARTYSCLADPAWEHAYSQMIAAQLTSLFWGFPSFPLTFLKLEATARWKVEPAVGNWRMKLSLPALGYIVAHSLFSLYFVSRAAALDSEHQHPQPWTLQN